MGSISPRTQLETRVTFAKISMANYIIGSSKEVGHGPDAWHQIDVAWDNGRTLMLVAPPDEFEVVA
jgi:hypothetical protein